MQAMVTSGTRLMVQASSGPDRTISVRTLGDARLRPGCEIPVLVEAEAMDFPGGTTALVTTVGVVTWTASIVRQQGIFLVRLGEIIHIDQRRREPRRAITLDLVAVPRDHSMVGPRVLSGLTVDVSRGGLHATLLAPLHLPHEDETKSSAGVDLPRLNAEITVSASQRIVAELQVVHCHHHTIRAAFTSIDRADQERLLALTGRSTPLRISP
ncbi:MAG: PilZ domain-containing protein [Actinomycetota bacterium]